MTTNDHRKSCISCGEFISLPAYKCRFCGEVQEGDPGLGITHTFSILSSILSSWFWLVPPIIAYGFIIEDMDSVKESFSLLDKVSRPFLIFLFLGMSFTLLRLIPSFREYKFLNANIPWQREEVKHNKLRNPIRWLVSLSVGLGIVWAMSSLQDNRPTRDMFHSFLQEHPIYSPGEMIRHSQEDFCTLYLISSQDKYVNYLGIGGRFVMVPYLPGYWAHNRKARN